MHAHERPHGRTAAEASSTATTLGKYVEEWEINRDGHGKQPLPHRNATEELTSEQTEHIQDALAACGWKDAQLLEQQDTSEAFAFITETLQLPLLTLQVDLFHQGKNDDADHKVVYERLLNLAVPPDSGGKGIRLEDCLEEYFNSQVDVLRDSLDEKKAGERFDMNPSPQFPDTSTESKGTIRVVTDEDQQEPAAPETENTPRMERRWTVAPVSRFPDLQPDSRTEASGSQSTALRPHRSRTESIIQRVVLDDQGKPSESDAASLFQRAKKTASVVKAVTIPAWQFFRLIRTMFLFLLHDLYEANTHFSLAFTSK